MSEGDQDVEDLEQLIICPYDSSHRMTAARMTQHLIKCRENFPISEKAICPFNGKHEIFAPEMDYHQSVCSQKSGENKLQQYISDGIDGDGENPKDKLFGSFSSETAFNFSCEANATGCKSGLDLVGGIRNIIEETNETGQIAFNAQNGAENRQPQNRLREDCGDVGRNDLVLPIEDELKSPNQSIENPLEQSESDTTSSETNSSIGNDEEERFDYTKYIPSKDLREDFLKLIGQPRNGQVYEAKCHSSASQPAVAMPAQWQPQGYSVIPAPFQTNNGYSGIQPTFVSFSNTYIPQVPSCPIPYANSYGFHNQTPAAPSFLQAPQGQALGYEYTVYPAARPNYYRCYNRRRNHYNFSRNNNHKSYISYNHGNHAETFLNGLNHSEIGLDEGNVNKLNGTHDEIGTSHSLCVSNGCDKEEPLLSAKLSRNSLHVKENKEGDGDEQQQLVGMNDAPEKQLIGDAKGEQSLSYHDVQDALKKSENEKQIRKIKKKLAEINGLEDKYRKGASLDCDQLKKLSRKSEFEDQLQLLGQS